MAAHGTSRPRPPRVDWRTGLEVVVTAAPVTQHRASANRKNHSKAARRAENAKIRTGRWEA